MISYSRQVVKLTMLLTMPTDFYQLGEQGKLHFIIEKLETLDGPVK